MKENLGVICGRCGNLITRDYCYQCQETQIFYDMSPCITCFSIMYSIHGRYVICSNPKCPEYYLEEDFYNSYRIKYKKLEIAKISSIPPLKNTLVHTCMYSKLIIELCKEIRDNLTSDERNL